MLLTDRRSRCGGAILALALTAPIAHAQAPEKCGTPVAMRATPASRRQPVDNWGNGREGARPPAVGPVALGVPVDPPTGATSAGTQATLPAPAPTGSQATPPIPPPPPAVPGLPRSNARNDDEDKRSRVAAIQATGEVPEERLLDIGIEIFGPGVDEDDREKLARVGLSPEVRKSEGRYMAYHLRKTLESTGNWGAVRVVPGPGEGLDVTVFAEILESNGKWLSLDVEAKDALGRRWLKKRYRGEADLSAYRAEGGAGKEAFQEVYNRIANDLLRARDDHDVEELVAVRRVAGLRFASQLAPEAFSPYVKSDKRGRYTLVRLPASGDPMMQRIARIRERDLMFVDTLNDYYLEFYDRMSAPYSDWKKYSYDEQNALDRVNRESRLKKLLGGAALLAGMMMPRDSRGGSMAGDAAIMGGMIAMQSGFQQSGQKKIHEVALKELATSFDAETTSLLVEVEGKQKTLTGSAEDRFVAWRQLLREVLALETQTPGDPNEVVVSGTTTY